jgi:uncharacterized membrane protein YgcG
MGSAVVVTASARCGVALVINTHFLAPGPGQGDIEVEATLVRVSAGRTAPRALLRPAPAFRRGRRRRAPGGPPLARPAAPADPPRGRAARTPSPLAHPQRPRCAPRPAAPATQAGKQIATTEVVLRTLGGAEFARGTHVKALVPASDLAPLWLHTAARAGKASGSGGGSGGSDGSGDSSVGGGGGNGGSGGGASRLPPIRSRL